MHTPPLSRRHLLHTLGAGLAVAASPGVWAQAAPAGAGAGTGAGIAASGKARQGRLVVVFLRGAYDGLSAFVPYADPEYYKLRPNIGIATPDGTADTALKLDDTFAMHPAMAPLMPLWQQGVLSFIPAAGLPAPNRSHFDAQYQIEIANPGKSNAVAGWMNKVAALNSKTQVTTLGIGEANPAILAGDAKVKLIPEGQAAERVGVLANATQRDALMDLYAGSDKISVAFRQGADSRMRSAQELTTEKTAMDTRREATAREVKRKLDRPLDKDGTPANTAAQNAQMQAASNGAADPVGLQLDAYHLGTLMRNDRNLSLGFLSAGGWDTHANQGNAKGQLADRLGNLAKGIAQLRQDFNEPGDTIIVMSEFGRTSAENGTRGTDHGFGNAMWLVGSRIQGGQWHGKWSGLARANLNENRDLPAHHDYRAVLAQLLRGTFAMSDSALASVLPGAKWDSALDGMIRKA